MQAALEQFLVPEARALLGELERSTGPAFRRLNAAVAGLVDEWGLVSFAPLDYSDEESVGDVLAQARPAMQSAGSVLEGGITAYRWHMGLDLT